MPTPGQTAKFAQLYIYDTKNEVSNRMKAIFKKKKIKPCNADTFKWF